MKTLKAIVIGAGSRGMCYTDKMGDSPEKFKVVGVAEPIEDRREYIKKKHGVEEQYCFDTWEKILDIPKFADIAVIATMDRMHLEPAIKALELGYDLLLEKPAAPTAEECGIILRKAEETGRKIMVCHVLRYTKFFLRLKELILGGTLGKVVSVQHIEAVGNVHQSHSFVRGNWGNSEESSFMLLQKCCHDLDILQWLLEKDCKKIQSFGNRTYFRSENAPEGAPERCHEGCPVGDTCPYNAMKLYYDDKGNDWFRGAATGVPHPDDEQVMEALKTTQYGKCVFKCNNDVVDHQIVNMEMEDGTTVAMTMTAFTKGGRETRIMGTKGELLAVMDAENGKQFKFFDFETRETKYLDAEITTLGDSITSGHGGGDDGIVEALYGYLTDELSAEDVSEIGISCKNHMLVFAAEESRLTGKIVDVKEFKKRFM